MVYIWHWLIKKFLVFLFQIQKTTLLYLKAPVTVIHIPE
nr:MAG TPA: hypothetical protein [Bacteriophage sp.]